MERILHTHTPAVIAVFLISLLMVSSSAAPCWGQFTDPLQISADNSGYANPSLDKNVSDHILVSFDNGGDVYFTSSVFHFETEVNVTDNELPAHTPGIASAQLGLVYLIYEEQSILPASFGDDILIVNNNGPVRLLINTVGSGSSWFGLRMVDSATGRDRYGTRVGFTLDDGRTLWRTVRANASYCSSNDPRVLFGLSTSLPVRIEARWADGRREEWAGSDYAVDRYHTLIKGSGRALP